LFTIMRSVWINKGTRAQRSPEKMTVSDLEARHGGTIELVDERAQQQVLENPDLESSPTPVQRALGELSSTFRMPLLLIDVGGLTYEEAAHVLDCAVGTVRSRLSRARKAMAAAVSPNGSSRGRESS